MSNAVSDYLEQHKIQQLLSEATTEILKQMPENPAEFLAQYFAKKATIKTTTIEKLVGRQILDSRGNPTVQVDVYCLVKGVSKMIGTLFFPLFFS